MAGLNIFKQSFFNIKHVERTEDFVSITISFTNNYVLCSLQKSIRNSLIHGFLNICKYLRFVSDNLGKDRPELTFFVVDIYSGN